MVSSIFLLRKIAFVLIIAVAVEAWTNVGHERERGAIRYVRLFAAKGNGDQGGYKFGDFTRSLGRRITGDENYQVRLLCLVFDITYSAATS